jgi:hypothetical protein
MPTNSSKIHAVLEVSPTPQTRILNDSRRENDRRIQEMFEEMANSDQLREDKYTPFGEIQVSNYTPCPIALGDVKVPTATVPLIKVVAKSMHECWLSIRERSGWVHGLVLDDTCKTHPDLVPFYELPPAAQVAQESAAAETIKLIVCAGCVINQRDKEGKGIKETHTQVPDILLPLRELIAYHLHEVWCKDKVSRGYRHGMTRSEKTKEHPQILPYYLLDIQERYFDQNSAKTSIMYILNSGCTISVPKGRSQSYEMDYGDSVYFNELQKQIAGIRHNLANEVKLQAQWMGGEKFTPKPLDLAAVVVPPEVKHLIEICAERMHDSWMETNERQGWCYGEASDHTQKTHPAMIPYEDLPADLRRADQVSAEQILRSILACGYTINQNDDLDTPSPMLKGRNVGSTKLRILQPVPRSVRHQQTCTARGRLTIPPEMRDLIEVIAYHLHETWSEEKMKQGYSFGSVRNHDKKHHPNLVPYYILTKSEQAYDLGSAEEAIMCVLKAGCIIKKPARILVGDLISAEFKDKWAVSAKVSGLLVQQVSLVHTNTDYSLPTFYTWIPTTRCWRRQLRRTKR